ncbi:hypothetical protein CesoFtcFv8_001859 [Champsocephalus esox]|uniref:Uncharacterized protein n=1 Tax=Champsocephalus esox TaxID=159716 RepID=A0AAN8HGZ2_9TELE|nr:hypothetical protein CesoFtcFv8_001859 [Champsocephalus esox]
MTSDLLLVQHSQDKAQQKHDTRHSPSPAQQYPRCSRSKVEQASATAAQQSREGNPTALHRLFNPLYTSAGSTGAERSGDTRCEERREEQQEER